MFTKWLTETLFYHATNFDHSRCQRNYLRTDEAWQDATLRERLPVHQGQKTWRFAVLGLQPVESVKVRSLRKNDHSSTSLVKFTPFQLRRPGNNVPARISGPEANVPRLSQPSGHRRAPEGRCPGKAGQHVQAGTGFAKIALTIVSKKNAVNANIKIFRFFY